MSAPSESAKWHGYLLASRTDLPLPKCITSAEDTLARKTCGTGITASEYADSDEVLRVKAAVLAKMWISAQKPVIFSGAGISTSSGINDYASSAAKSVVQPKQPMKLTMTNIRSLQPTMAHFVLTAMERMGLVWGWLQQNHDGLAQKAGFPPQKCNEIHGAWLDKEKNPVIAMSGNLRSDMFEWCLEMEKQSDFVFGVGTSYSGLNADRVSITTGKRHQKAFLEARKKTAGPTPSAILPEGSGQGLAILSLQKTPLDDIAALRIFSTIDRFMLIFAHHLCHVAAQTMGDPSRDFAVKVFSKFNIDVRNPNIAASHLIDPNHGTVPYAPTPLPVGPPTNAQWLDEQKALRKGWLGDEGAINHLNAALDLYIASPCGAGDKASATTQRPSVITNCPATVAASFEDRPHQEANRLPQKKVLEKKVLEPPQKKVLAPLQKKVFEQAKATHLSLVALTKDPLNAR